MNQDETFTWLAGILPSPVEFAQVQLGPSTPSFGVARVLLGDVFADATPTDPAPQPAETVAATVDASRITPQLETEDGSDLRVELITVVSGHSGVAERLVAGAASMIAENPLVFSPQPGTVLPRLADEVERGLPARNGLLVVPYLWDEGVPHVHEVSSTGRRAKDNQNPAAAEFTHPGRLTLLAQLVMITDEELEYMRRASAVLATVDSEQPQRRSAAELAAQVNVGEVEAPEPSRVAGEAVAALQQRLVAQQINLNDIWRS